jgi:hypothetical protein
MEGSRVQIIEIIWKREVFYLYLCPKAKDTMIKIYVLKDPRNNSVRYVGATVSTLKKRLTGHVWDARHLSGTRKVNWIKQLLELKLKPQIELLEETEDWIVREKYWVSYYKQRTELVNSTSGGEGVFKKDKDSIKRSSEAKFTPITQFSLSGDIIQEWNCIRDATVALGLARNSIKNNLRGRSATCGGFIWKYKNKETPESGRKAFTKHKKWIE